MQAFDRKHTRRPTMGPIRVQCLLCHMTIELLRCDSRGMRELAIQAAQAGAGRRERSSLDRNLGLLQVKAASIGAVEFGPTAA